MVASYQMKLRTFENLKIDCVIGSQHFNDKRMWRVERRTYPTSGSYQVSLFPIPTAVLNDTQILNDTKPTRATALLLGMHFHILSIHLNYDNNVDQNYIVMGPE